MTVPILTEVLVEDFGRGAHSLVGVEQGLVLFLLGLVTGVFAMTALFIWLLWRERMRRQLPAETEDLLEEFDENAEIRPEPLKPNQAGRPDPEEDRKDWERGADWWKGER